MPRARFIVGSRALHCQERVWRRRALGHDRNCEFPAGTSGELGDVVETLKRGLLAPPEPGDLAIDQKRSQLQVALVRARIASHGPSRLLRLADRRHITSYFAKIFFFEFRWKQVVAQHFSLCIPVKCPPYLP